MAGLIRREDIDAVRERADLREVVEQYVTLKGAGIGSWKGLCPFHDERSPSFHIRPQVGTYHCFGCGESGDVIAFLMAMEHTSFQETVEKLAGKHGIELRYEDGGKGPDKAEIGRRQRLLDAHKIADEFYRKALLSPEAQTAREFLSERGFTREHAEKFDVGYAPKAGTTCWGTCGPRGSGRTSSGRPACSPRAPAASMTASADADVAHPGYDRQHRRLRRAPPL